MKTLNGIRKNISDQLERGKRDSKITNNFLKRREQSEDVKDLGKLKNMSSIKSATGNFRRKVPNKVTIRTLKDIKFTIRTKSNHKNTLLL